MADKYRTTTEEKEMMKEGGGERGVKNLTDIA
jgi:hypothetical protein